MNQYVPDLSLPPTERDHRDAVHVAVLPAVAGENLTPGDPVSLCTVNGKFHAYAKGVPCGVVSPFLRLKGVTNIRQGRPCWVLMEQGTIEHLRHTWTHPALRVLEKLPITEYQSGD